MPYNLIVIELQNIVSRHPEIKNLLLSSIENAAVIGTVGLNDYYEYLDKFYNFIPFISDKREFRNQLVKFYWFLNTTPGLELQKNIVFSSWLLKFFQEWGSFLNTPESYSHLQNLKSFKYHYNAKKISPAMNFKSFNDFIQRPAERSIEARKNNNIIVFPSDGILKGVGDLSNTPKVKENLIIYDVLEMISASSYSKNFIGASYAHISLNSRDYQRFHTPSNGVLLEKRIIPYIVSLGIKRSFVKKIIAVQGDHYQFIQDRNIFVFNNHSLGLFAIIPFALVQISSIKSNVNIGMPLSKGEEVGSFEGGGADIIMVFANNNIKFTKEIGKHYKQGEEVAVAY